MQPSNTVIRRLALKIDVDTYQGLRDGVPRMLEILSRHQVPASFYVAMGPDNSGKAIRRLFTQRGFARKMIRSNALRLYGFPTVLYGTLLPAPQIARSFPDLLRQIRDEGHELGVHGNDHVYWHDKLLGLGEREVEAEIGRALETFREIVGADPAGFAAPGWQCTAASVTALDRGPFRYHSCTRGVRPYRPRFAAIEGRLPELPTTLPTLDELLGRGDEPARALATLLAPGSGEALDVLTVHTEVEGGPYADFFDELLERLRGTVRFVRLVDAADTLPAPLPVCRIAQGTLPGRGGTVSCQVI